jgi:1,4-alpha-glucan branching enzyme
MSIPKIIESDAWLKPHEFTIIDWQLNFQKKVDELVGDRNLVDFATGHLYYGLHKNRGGWIIREWVPNATQLFLVGSFNNWENDDNYKFKKGENGNWSLQLKTKELKHKDLYALFVRWDGGEGKRIPAWATRVVQDSSTYIFNAQVWLPEKPFKWEKSDSLLKIDSPLIYEAHIGMAGENECVHTYNEFREDILPRINANGYNTIQLMAIPEHPYYGSFGYHVSSFFAPSSRFGTPEELKQLIDEAHGLGIAVIMDLVHSHAVKNEAEGLGNYDGTRYQFFHDGARGEHPA